MHEYTQALIKRFMGISRKSKRWDGVDTGWLAGFIFEKAPSCLCGCGQKVLPKSSIKRLELFCECSPEIFNKYISGHAVSSFSPMTHVSSEAHQNILAAMIGDGCLLKAYEGSNYRLAWNMGNESHARSKLRAFEWAKPKFTHRNNPGFGSEWYQVRTACSPVFTSYAEKYGNSRDGYKVGKISSELDAMGWAIYYGDDGHLAKRYGNAFIHTEGFDHDGVLAIKNNLCEFIGLDGVSVYGYMGGKNKRYLECLRMGKHETIEFFKRIKPYMEDGLEYKIF